MKLHKQFIQILAEKKRGTVGLIIVDMKFLKLDNDVIQNLAESYKTLEQIYYTVHFLEKESLTNIEMTHFGKGTPMTFNPLEYWKSKEEGKREYWQERMKYIDDMNKTYWGKEIAITPTFYDFIDNGYRTEKQLQDTRNIWIPVSVAIVSSFLTALFGYVFGQNSENTVYNLFI
jgi:hypothetical protein